MEKDDNGFVVPTVIVLLIGIGVWIVVPAPPARSDAKSKAAAAAAAKALRKQTKKVNRQLMIEAQYSCCISPGCSFCTLTFGKCPCAANLAKKKGVCHTCKGGWEAGHGADPAIKPGTVKVWKGKELKKVYDTRKKAMKAAR